MIRTLAKISLLGAWLATAATAFAAPQYQIFVLGVVQSQGFGVSPGGVVVGSHFRPGWTQAFRWTQGGGFVGLPNPSGNNRADAMDANDSGIVVGTATTPNRLPMIWNNGVVSLLPLPAGETLGDANGVNASGIAVGSVDGGSLQQAVIYNGANATVITQTTPTGCFFVTAFGINDSGRIVGTGIDPNNAARNVGMVYDMGSGSAFEVGALPNANGALAFAVGTGGHVVGSSMMNQGSGLPFIWSAATGMVAIPLATGTTQGSARGVNSSGWVVGQDSSAFSIPFLWDGMTTYRLADLLPAGSGWDLDMNTSSSALGISDSGIIVGTGVHNGETHAYAMVPVQGTPTPTPTPTPGPATHFAVSAPSDCIVNQPCPFSVTAKDQFNNTATSYAGTVHFTSTEASATLPADSTLTNGTGTFNMTFHFWGTHTITATDTVTPSITGTSNPISVAIVDPTATPTPTPTPASTPTATPIPPTPTPIPRCSPSYTVAAESFDQVVPPALPTDWVATNTQGPAPLWVTSTSGLPSPPFESPASAAYVDDPNVISDKRLESRTIHLFGGPGTSRLSFRHNFDLEAGHDGGVLEIRSELGTFKDILIAGGTFVAGGYTSTVSSPSCPIDGRQAWTGTSAGFVTTIVDLPPYPSIVLRWRMASDAGGAGTGWRVDNIVLTECPKATPPPTATATATPTPSPSPNPTPTPTQTPSPTASATVAPTPTPSATPTSTPTKALNLSTRMRVQTGNNVGIGGFIISGNASENVAIRGIGPSLSGFGITDALADPTLELRDSNGGVIKLNDDWTDNAADAAQLTLLGLAPSNSKESGMVATLQPGTSYTAIVAGKNQTTGVGLVEIYDVNQTADSQLANISTRSFVLNGNDVTIAGFILGGNNSGTRIVVRGLGPSLSQFGLSPVLADPTLELRDSNGTLLISDDDWQDDPTMTMPGQLVARGLAPQNPKESAVIVSLPPGAFTAILAGKNGGTGIGLVEIYNVQ